MSQCMDADASQSDIKKLLQKPETNQTKLKLSSENSGTSNPSQKPNRIDRDEQSLEKVSPLIFFSASSLLNANKVVPFEAKTIAVMELVYYW